MSKVYAYPPKHLDLKYLPDMAVYRFKQKPSRQVLIDGTGKQYAGEGWDELAPGEVLRAPASYSMSLFAFFALWVLLMGACGD